VAQCRIPLAPKHDAQIRLPFQESVRHCRVVVSRSATDGLEYVGYEFRGYGGQIRISQKKLSAFKQRSVEIFRRISGRSMESRFEEYRCYARGWLSYFALEQVKSTLRDLDKWLRRRVRACFMRQWSKSKTRLRKLVALGVPKRVARGTSHSGKGPWRLSMTAGIQRALTIEYLTELGLFDLESYWDSFAPLRRTAGCGPACPVV